MCVRCKQVSKRKKMTSRKLDFPESKKETQQPKKRAKKQAQAKMQKAQPAKVVQPKAQPTEAQPTEAQPTKTPPSLLQQQQAYKAVTMKKMQRCQRLELLVNSDKKWKKALQEDPTTLMSKIINFFAAHEDPAMLMELSLRILTAVKDNDIKREQANHWRARLVNRVRVVLDEYNGDLNKVTSRISTIKKTETPNNKPDKRDIVDIIDVVSDSDDSDSSKVDNNGITADDGSTDDCKVVNKGSKPKTGPKREVDKGPTHGDGSNGSAGPADTSKAEEDFYNTKVIPKDNISIKNKFLQMYPNGYPDDSKFVHLGHYLSSTRSKSGYKHISECKDRSENWRVKFTNTVGRYYKLAKACEVKNKKDADDFAKPNTFPEAMYDA